MCWIFFQWFKSCVLELIKMKVFTSFKIYFYFLFLSFLCFILFYLFFIFYKNIQNFFTFLSSSFLCSSKTTTTNPSFSTSSSSFINQNSFDSLFYTSKYSIYFKILLICLIISNISLFIWSNMSRIANIIGILYIRQEEYDLGTIFHFTLGETVQDMWDAKTYLLAILLAIFSGTWPFIKLITMLLAFILPTSILSISWRNWILTWMDILGKWSLLDIYFMVILMIAFELDLFLLDEIELHAYVEPLWGFYSFLLATILSLILGHIMLHIQQIDEEESLIKRNNVNQNQREAIMNYECTIFLWETLNHENNNHNSIQQIEGIHSELVNNNNSQLLINQTEIINKNENNENNETNSLLENQTNSFQSFFLSKNGKWLQKTIQLTPFGKILMIILLLFSYFIILLGCTQTTFQFEFRGLVGFLLQSDSTSSYSVFNLGVKLPNASTTPNNLLIRWLQICYFIYSIITPFLFIILFLILWIVPLTINEQYIGLILNKILLAWCSFDVFFISMLASVYEIQQFAEFIIGDACDEINKILKEYFDELLNGDDVCFDVVASLKKVSFFII